MTAYCLFSQEDRWTSTLGRSMIKKGATCLEVMMEPLEVQCFSLSMQEWSEKKMWLSNYCVDPFIIFYVKQTNLAKLKVWSGAAAARRAIPNMAEWVHGSCRQKGDKIQVLIHATVCSQQ